MSEIEKQTDKELENVAGGFSQDGWATVSGLQTGYLAMRTKPGYDYSNEIRGSESYNGDKLKIVGAPVTGPDGKTYVPVYNPRTGLYGWTNFSFLF
jgi:hypothetical protein